MNIKVEQPPNNCLNCSEDGGVSTLKPQIFIGPSPLLLLLLLLALTVVFINVIVVP